MPTCYIMNMCGFPQGFTFSSTSPATSPNHYNVCPVTQLYMRSNYLRSFNYEMTAANKQQNLSSIIATLNLATSFDTYLINTTLIPLTSRLATPIIANIDLYLTSSNALVPPNLRGLPWSCTLVIVEREGTNPEPRPLPTYDDILRQSQNPPEAQPTNPTEQVGSGASERSVASAQAEEDEASALPLTNIDQSLEKIAEYEAKLKLLSDNLKK